VKLASLSHQERKELQKAYAKQVLSNVVVFKGRKYYTSDIGDYLHRGSK